MAHNIENSSCGCCRALAVKSTISEVELATVVSMSKKSEGFSIICVSIVSSSSIIFFSIILIDKFCYENAYLAVESPFSVEQTIVTVLASSTSEYGI